MEILGVAKFGNLQISQVTKFRNLQNLGRLPFFVTCEISQVAMLMYVHAICFLIHLLVVLYKFTLM